MEKSERIVKLEEQQELLRKEQNKISKELEKLNKETNFDEAFLHVGKFYKEPKDFNKEYSRYHHVYDIDKETNELKVISLSFWSKQDDYYSINTEGNFWLKNYDGIPFEERYIEVTECEFMEASELIRQKILKIKCYDN